MSTAHPLPVGELQPQSGHTRNGLNVVPAESGEEGEPGLYLHLPGKGRLERDVITFDWASKRLDKVTRQSERKGNKNPKMEFKTLKTANHRKKGADHLCRFITSYFYNSFICCLLVQLALNKS